MSRVGRPVNQVKLNVKRDTSFVRFKIRLDDNQIKAFQRAVWNLEICIRPRTDLDCDLLRLLNNLTVKTLGIHQRAQKRVGLNVHLLVLALITLPGTLALCANVAGQSDFRRSKMTDKSSSPLRPSKRLAAAPQGSLGERSEYQFPTNSSRRVSPPIQQRGFVESPTYGTVQPNFSVGMPQQHIPSSLSGQIYTNPSANGGFNSGQSQNSNQGGPIFDAFIPNQDSTAAAQVEEAIRRYNANEAGDPYPTSLQRGAGRLHQEIMEPMPPPLSVIENNARSEGLEVVVQRYANGRPRIIRHVDQDPEGNYYNHGPWEVRSESGKTVAKGAYSKGMMDGQWSREHSADSSGLFKTRPFNLFQGPYHSVAVFKEGKLNGLWTISDRNGSKIFEIEYKEGVRHGIATWFLPQQGKMREATFKDGLIDGEIVEYGEYDKVVKRDQYVEGRKIVRNTSFYRPKVKRSEEYFLSAKLEPEDEDNWWEAKPTPFLSRGSETQHGSSMAWYENGQPKKRGQFEQGIPIGQFTWWHANGNKQIEGYYAEGQRSRPWTWWHENGFKQFEGTFEDDKPVGLWRSWFDDGQLRTEKDYSDSTDASENDQGVKAQESGEESSSQEPDSESQTNPEETTPRSIVDPTPTDSNPDSVIDPFDGQSDPINETEEQAIPSETESLPTPPAPDATESLEEISPDGFRDPKLPGEIPSEKADDAGAGGQIKDSDTTGEIGEIPFNEPKSDEPKSDEPKSDETKSDETKSDVTA